MNECLEQWISLSGGWYCFCLMIFSLFYFVCWFLIQGAGYTFNSNYSYFGCQGKDSKYFGRGFFNFLLIFFYLGGNEYGIPRGTVVTGIFDMCPGKHDLHFLVGVKLLPHAFVKIPDEKMHIGVFIFILVICYLFLLYILHFIYIYS
jgi:hypothetical protein